MKKYTVFEKTACRRPIEKKFFRFCLWRQFSLIKFIPCFLWFGFLRSLGIIGREKYLARRWSFLGSVKELGAKLDRFASRMKKKIFIPAPDVILLSEHPSLVIEPIAEVCGCDCEANEFDTDNRLFKKFTPAHEAVGSGRYEAYGPVFDRLLKGAEVRHYVLGRKLFKHRSAVIALLTLRRVLTYAALLAWSVFLGFISLYWASRSFTYGEPDKLFEAFLANPVTVRMNVLPVVFLAAILYLASNSAAFSSLITSVLTMVLTWINHFKLMFRDDPFMFEDLTIAMEARQMSESYEIVLSPEMIWMMAIMAAVAVVFALFGRVRTRPFYLRAGLLVLALWASVWGLNEHYFSGPAYKQTANDGIINVWSSTQQFQVRGFIYPFINSAADTLDRAPEGYNKKQAEAVLNEYEAEDIPEDKRVNVIAVMLEAYADFTRIDGLEFTNDPYHYMKELAEEAYTGSLITNIFAAGTVDTERCFLTGLVDLPNFRTATNSHVRFFGSQGYLTEGGHPSYDWFYNRKNVNRHLGFDGYYFDQDTYMELNGGNPTANNDILFDHILEKFGEATENAENYFSFSVTYEGHGPYSSDPFFWHEYMANKGYEQTSYDTINNYFSIMEHAGYTVVQMVEELKKSDEPVVVITFGDHMPWMGNSNSIYEDIGINLDTSTDEGFFNYYETPYMIWANDAAKEILGFDFVGEGPTLSPGFLMAHFFEKAGWKGSEYIQYLNDLSKVLPVVHNTGVAVDAEGNIVREPTNEQQALLDEYAWVQYYWQNNLE
ncbi:MAG: LTA synthase family protein [Clostridia bacterium]|nr:LTA synthase family protein [Clostridia bacterium]